MLCRLLCHSIRICLCEILVWGGLLQCRTETHILPIGRSMCGQMFLDGNKRISMPAGNHVIIG